MRTPLAILAVLALSVATSPMAIAADDLMACQKLSVKPTKINPPTSQVEFSCRAPASGFGLPDAHYVELYGASLLIRDLGSSLYIIPGASLPGDAMGHWLGLGTPPGSKGFRYSNKAQDAPCRVVVVTARGVKGKCRASMGFGTLPVVGEVGMTLTFVASPENKRYCAQFGGTEARNDVDALIRKKSPAPAACPPEP